MPTIHYAGVCLHTVRGKLIHNTLHMNVQKSEPPPRRRYIIMIIGEHSQIVEKENDAFHMNVQ